MFTSRDQKSGSTSKLVSLVGLGRSPLQKLKLLVYSACFMQALVHTMLYSFQCAFEALL